MRGSENLTNCDHKRTCFVSGQGQGLASTMPREQNRVAKGSTLLRRRSTLPIWEYYLSRSAVAWAWILNDLTYFYAIL